MFSTIAATGIALALPSLVPRDALADSFLRTMT
jgi:hypothetical protein